MKIAIHQPQYLPWLGYLDKMDSADVFIVLDTAQLVDGEVAFGETHIFAGRNFIITVRHGPSLSYTPVRQRCEDSPARLAMGRGRQPVILARCAAARRPLPGSVDRLRFSAFASPFPDGHRTFRNERPLACADSILKPRIFPPRPRWNLI